MFPDNRNVDFAKMVSVAPTIGALERMCIAESDWLMSLQHSEPWLYGDMADAIAIRTMELKRGDDDVR